MSLRFDTPSVAEDGTMANKPAHKKRAVKKPESAKVELKEATAAKEAPAPNGGRVLSPNKDVVNAETAQVFVMPMPAKTFREAPRDHCGVVPPPRPGSTTRRSCSSRRLGRLA
jgi:hypothetical protein